MDDERQKKLEAGREKLVAYKKKKQKKHQESSGSTPSASQSDSSLSLSPPLLPENAPHRETAETELLSDSSVISEHIQSSDSVENDRSYQEIEISNIPSNFSLILQNLPSDEDVEYISQEIKPPSLNTSVRSSNSTSLSVLEKIGSMSVDVKNNVQSILDEILQSEQFKSDSEHTLHKPNVSVDSNDSSFNIFEGIDLNDSLVNDYGLKSNRTEDTADKSVNKSNNASLNSVNFNISLSNVEKSEGTLKVKQLEELLSTKDTAIAALAAELESLRELTSSNHSTLSLNTSTTDYKLYHDEFQSKIVEFQNALSHRDTVIQQLTEALQQSVINREQLQDQSEYFSREIVALQKQLAETSAIISQRKWDISESEVKHDSIKSIKDSSIQTDSLPSQILQVDAQNLNTSKKFETESDKLPEKVNVLLTEEKLCSLREAEEVEGLVTTIAHETDGDKLVLNLEIQCSKLEETLNLSQIDVFNELKNCINFYIQHKTLEYQTAHENELKILEDKLENEKMDHEAETERLRELLASVKCDSVDIVTLRQELEAKHTKELEELRTYFEQKCADLEKHYSEEVFSQQSRKMSGSSSSSETSDFIYSSSCPQPGPGGDTVKIQVDISKISPTKRDFSGLNKNDIIKLKTDLSNIAKDLEKYNLENISKQDLKTLRVELKKYDLRSLLKYDLSVLKTEMQNKYHAELEILREDYENRIDALNVEHDNRMQSIERKYVDKIESLKFDLDEALRNVDMNVSTAVQEVMLVANTAEDAEWPTELLQLRNRFTESYEKQIVELEQQYQEEIAKLKEEHHKILNGALERARRKSLKDNDSLSQTDLDIIKERDNLKKTTSVLRQLIGELMKYFSECEEELNNTLVEELLRQGFEKNLTELEVEINLNESSNSTCSDSLTNGNKKRVHFTPKFEELMATIDSSVPSSLDSNISLDLKNELGACLKRLRADANAILALSTNVNKNEGKLLEFNDPPDKLMESTSTSLQERISSLTRQLIAEGQIKRDLVSELDEAKNFVQSLEAERSNLDAQVEQLIAKQKILETDLGKAREKISELIENGHKEIVSEGYGENPKLGTCNLGERIATLSELQDRARSMVAECATSADHPLLQLVEELCREGERITEEAKNDHEDLQQQVNVRPPFHLHRIYCQKIEAADKKLRATCHFLEEQAAEREQERDEAQKEIASLREQLREREKDRVSCERINSEVEHLEQQMREMSKLIEENEIKHADVETEKKEAVEKIFVLRDIIRDLESQVEIKTEVESELRTLIDELQEVVKQQNKTNEELSQHLSSGKSISETRFQEHIQQLEDEVQRLRLNTEFVGSEGVLKQIKTQLNEFELNIDKRTRDLEALHSAISATSCSSPSEDMSLRDQIPQKVPTVLDECDVPLQQLARLKEKLVKHSRAEDAAVKRIRDLEMELSSGRHELDEIQNERDLLQDQVSEQLVLISSLQMRLDDQRLRAEQVQKQTNTSLEVRIYDLEMEIKNMIETINSKDKTIRQLNKTIEETRKRLSDQEQELTAQQEDKVIADLHKEIQKIRAENVSLLTKISNDAQNAQVLPNLVDNILSDKNKDIEKLREQLDKTQSELSTFLSLNLDHEQLKALSKLQSSERAFSDILSLANLDVSDKMRMAEKTCESLNTSMNSAPFKRNVNETTFIGSGAKYEPDISSIELVEQPNIHYSVEAPLAKPNSTEIHKSAEKRVHFDESIYNNTIEKLQGEILDLKNEIFARDETITEYTERLKILADLEVNVEKLQEKLEFTETALQRTTETFEKELNTFKEVEKNLKIELAEKKMHLTEKEKQLELSEQDSARKDQMYINLAKEKRELEKSLNQLQIDSERKSEFDNILAEKNQEIQNLKLQLSAMGDSLEKIKVLETELNSKQEELKNLQQEYIKLQEETNSKSSSLNEFKEKLAVCNNEIKEKDELNSKISKDLKNKESQCNSLNQEVELLKQAIEDKNKEIEVFQQNMQEEERKSLSAMEVNLKAMKNLLVDRETEIEILNEDATRYQDDIAQLENKLRSIKNSMESEYELKLAQNMKDIAAKELQIVKLTTNLEDSNREINHLQELLNKKEQIVSQMSEDSKSLHVNLETIQNKMQEAGNVFDLKRRLEDEQQLNSTLQQELNAVKNIIANNDYNKPVDMTASIEEITGAVRKQLDYSAHLDSSILNALSSSDGEHMPSVIETDDVQILKRRLSKERKLNVELTKIKDTLQLKLQEFEQKYENEKENAYYLQTLLENEKQNCNAIQVEDANMLEQLRIRLEGALENETEFEKLLDTEKRARQELELQVMNLKQKFANFSSGENSKTELTEYKSLPNLDSHDVVRLRRDVQILQDENAKLKKEIKSLKRGKTEIEANLKYTKDMLQLKNEEIQKLEGRIEGMKEMEGSLKEKWITCKADLDKRNQEIENSRVLMEEIEQEGKQMKKEINRLNENLKRAIERERKLMDSKEGQMKQIVPDKFLNKMKELTTLVKEHMKDNKQMSEAVDKLTDERRILQERINELEELNNIQIPFDDPVARANHLFARYLRSESYRKALIWQKKYLTALLASYQTYPLFSQELPLSSQFRAVVNRPVRSNGKERFKAIVVGVIAIIRMQFLVQRWHSGKRGVRSQQHRRPPRSTHHIPRTANIFLQPPAQFQVGQPVSSQNFPIQNAVPTNPSNLNRFHSLDTTNSPAFNFSQRIDQVVANANRLAENAFPTNESRRPKTPNSPVELGPWSGVTPPSKDHTLRSGRSRNVGHSRGMVSTSEDYVPLQAPALLSQYVERFDQIQQRLGLDKNSA